MIGNLLFALGLAICCGAGLTDEPQNATYNTNITSHVTGESIYCISQYNVEFDREDFSYYFSSMVGDGSYNNDQTASSLDIRDLSNAYAFGVQKANDSRIYYFWYDDGIGVTLRFFVPLSANVSSIELKYQRDAGSVDWAGIGYGNVNDYNLNNIGGLVEDEWYLINYQTSISSTTSYSSSDFSIYATKFCEYFFYFRSSQYFVASFDIYLCGGINLNYEQGYAVGYSNGYNAGLSRGYGNGYAEGLLAGSSANANIKNLFGVIADTPIRYLRQMFNFDLFGMNVAVVILSCLTAIIVFNFIKKVWK